MATLLDPRAGNVAPFAAPTYPGNSIMLRRHLVAISAITSHPSLAYRVRQYFALGSRPLLVELSRACLCHADIVLCLIRIGTKHARRIAESLIGKPITIGPACRFVYPSNRSSPLVKTQATIARVLENISVRRRTRLFMCMPEFKVGRTREQLLARGVSRGDIRRAVRRGIITMTEGRI
jgi:hypothetical protein